MWLIVHRQVYGGTSRAGVCKGAIGSNSGLTGKVDLSGFNPLICGNDGDSVDVATRVAMVSGICNILNAYYGKPSHLYYII